MATKDVNTRFRLEFEGKGAEQLQKKINSLSDSLAPEKMSAGFQRMEHFMKSNERQLRGMERHFKSLNQTLHQFGSTVDKINEMASGLGKVRDNAKAAGEEAKKAGQQGAFTQGLVQGLGVGEYIPRGPGMGRQVAGRLAGGAIRAPFASTVGGMTSGVGGLAQGLASIPGGGIAGGLIQAAMSNVQQFRQFERTRLQAAPFLNVSGMMETQQARAAAAAKARSGVMARPIEQFMDKADLVEGKAPTVGAVLRGEALGETAEGLRATGRAGAMTGVLDPSGVMEDPTAPLSTPQQKRAAERAVGQATEAARQRQKEAADRAARDAAAAVEAGPTGLEGLRGIGRNLGAMNLQQTTQLAAQVAAASGGRLTEIRGMEGRGGGDLVSAAMAAQTAYGIDPSQTGAFGRAARRGGLTGVGETGAETFARTLGDAVAAGMDASEVKQFMAETAAGIQQFRQTGIPMSPETVIGIGREVSLAGVEIGRGQFLAGQFKSRAQQVGMQGPQTAADFLMLQKVGGFEGGGLESLEAAQERMIQFRESEVGSDQFQDVVRSISEGSGGGVAGRFALRRAFAGMGMQIGVREAKALQAQATTGQVPEELKDVYEKVKRQMREGEKSAPSGLAGLEDQARAAVKTLASSLKGQVDIENKRLAVGARLTKTMDNLERSTLNAQGAVAEFGPSLNVLTEQIHTISKLLPDAAKYMQTQISSEPNQSLPSDGTVQ